MWSRPVSLRLNLGFCPVVVVFRSVLHKKSVLKKKEVLINVLYLLVLHTARRVPPRSAQPPSPPSSSGNLRDERDGSRESLTLFMDYAWGDVPRRVSSVQVWGRAARRETRDSRGDEQARERGPADRLRHVSCGHCRTHITLLN